VTGCGWPSLEVYISDDECVSTYLFMCFVCYDIVTSLDAMECDVVCHLFIIDTSDMTFITVHLVIPGLDILFTSSFLTVWRLTCRD